ncbi:6-hydroxypseudooxynicotine dehydrogenase complex subunit alpha [Neomoorella glycerini]|uniref:6-hydroxypseudooxynicotine dehydrogenase complex subunit alpha n=1 Tax=Neomoorella glycerini TaxID=55779 RepID=A0A6I5ZMW9_9FIRM|nr:FAD binding domain-containing protein [Moorella glycerini]QGP91218.1 6-hydroxypseudooxynicotine dehydrogenase complex subunit alpha [Moorella glycerini]
MVGDYLVTTSIAEAIAFLASRQGQARIIAGGTDLLIDLQEGKKETSCLVDISSIQDLKNILYEENYIKIGAGVTHNEVARSPIIQQQATLLAEAAAIVGSPQIRNTGTIVGNIVNAQPAADTAVALAALDAEVEVIDSKGRQYLRVTDCYAGRGISRIDSTRQLVVAVRFVPLKTGQGSAFIRFAMRKSLALPIMNVAAIVAMEQGRITRARVVVAPAGPAPFRVERAEKLLCDQFPSKENLRQAARVAAEEAPFRDSPLRGSREYRRALAEVLVEEALAKAVQRAKESAGHGGY